MSKEWKLKAGRFLYDNKPQILSGIACIGVVSTAVLASRATLKLSEVMERYEQKITANGNQNERSNIRVILKGEKKWNFLGDVTLLYVPTLISGTIAITCIVMSNRISIKRTAVMAGLYSAAQESKRLYQARVLEKLGPRAEREVRSKVAQDHIIKNPPRDGENVFQSKGESLCYDPQSGRYFYCDYETIQRAVNDINRDLLSESFRSLNDFYYELGIPNIKLGGDFGWYIDGEWAKVDLETMLTDDMRPCIILVYDVYPKLGVH